jgi:TolA-binding protein
MADEGNGLHDPWAPPDKTPPIEQESDVPTRATPIEPASQEGAPVEPEPVESEPVGVYEPEAPPEPVPPFQPVPYEPVAIEYPPSTQKRRWPGAAKAIVIILAVLLVATVAGLGYGWWKTNEDKKDLESASNQQGQELSQQLDKANKDLATTQQSLTTSQQDLAAANAKVSDLQGQVTSAQTDATTAKDRADALAGLFPLNAAKVQAGTPGTYRSPALTAQPGGCSLATCPSAQLTLTVESAGGGLTVSDPALGHVPLTASGAGWTATGPTAAALQLSCNGAPVATTFTLSVSPAAIALDSKDAPQVTTLGGSLLLSSAAVPAVVEPPSAACPAGIGSYVFAANRV